MVVPCIEIIKFPASESFKADPLASVAPTQEILTKRSGHIKTYFGLETEDPNVGYGFILWDNIDSHKALMNDKAVYETLGSRISACVAGGVGAISMYHVHTHLAPFAALEAPITELAYLKLKEGQDVGEVAPLVAELSGLETKGLLLSTYGSVHENKDHVVLVVGWESMEAHAAATSNSSSKAASLVPGILERTSLSVVHVKLAVA